MPSRNNTDNHNHNNNNNNNNKNNNKNNHKINEDDDDDDDDEYDNGTQEYDTTSDDEGHLNIHDELSGDTLSALLQFMHGGVNCIDDNDGNEEEDIETTTALISHESTVITETLRRLKEQQEATAKALEQRIDQQILLELEYSEKYPITSATTILISDGVVMLPSILSSKRCDECLNRINEDLRAADHDDETAMYDCNGFGKVHSRHSRFDIYLHNDGVYHKALRDMLCRGSTLADLFSVLFSDQQAAFHELAALISDPGSTRQPIHPDSKYSPNAVLYTCFIALQDVTDAMGPTWFLPSTHTQEAHERHNSDDEKAAFLTTCEYRKALLKKGDVVIMDSRTLHCGGPNVSERSRRVLMYFTLRNPQHSSLEKDFPPNGSKWPKLQMLHTDFS